jgi:hypothetical protein
VDRGRRQPKEVAARAGHAWVSFTLDRYGHLHPEADTALRDRLDVLYGAARPTPEAVPPARPRRVQPLRLSRCWRRSWAASSTALWRHSAARYWQAIKPMRWRRRKSP